MLIIASLMVFGFTVSAHATLIDNGDGTVTQIRDDPIYGDGSTLMWLKDANAARTSLYDADGGMTWAEANTWIASLNSSNYLLYNDWRLPDTNPVNGTSYNYSVSYDGSTDHGYNITSPNSEMAYMYYVELGNLGYFDTSGSGPQAGWGHLPNPGLFDNLQKFIYWSGTEYATFADTAGASISRSAFKQRTLSLVPTSMRGLFFPVMPNQFQNQLPLHSSASV